MTYLFLVFTETRRRVFNIMFNRVLIGIMLLALVSGVMVVPPHPAAAQGGADGAITHTTVTDFSASCSVVFPDTPSNPGGTGITIGNVGGGEIRLGGTVLEDNFDDTAINGSLWVQTDAYSGGPSGSAVEANGVVTLEAIALRSQMSFDQSNRFFEARALVQINSDPPGWPDLGFYRQLPPLYYSDPIAENTSIRIFVFPDDGRVYARARDGGTGTLIDDYIDPPPDLTQYHLYRIEWDPSETRYFIDGDLVSTLTGNSSLPGYAFLYSQDPSDTGGGRSPLQVDWVRAGQYATSGTYESCVLDAGGIVNWTNFSAASNVPANTSLSFVVRSSVNGTNWSGWTAVNSGNITSPSGRYLQYRANLSTSDVTESPEVQQVSVSYYGPNSIVVTPPGTAPLAPGSGSQQFSAQAYDINNRAVSNLNYSWQVVNGGGTINSSGLFTAGLPAGTFANTVRASTTGTGGTVNGFATVSVNNLPPTANAGGAYSGYEGLAVSLDGSGSSDPNGTGGLSYAWDLDDDGQFDDATGVSPSYSWPDNGTFPIELRMTDSGGLISTATSTATIANVAPTIISVTSSGPVNLGEVVTITVDAIDPAGAEDTLKYSFDWDNNGVYEIVDQNSNQATHTFASGGSYVVGVRVKDEDGGEDTDSAVAQVGSKNVYLPLIVR